MFGWFKPKCPVSTREKAWLEYRFGWLLETLGTTRIRHAVTVLPTAEFLPFSPALTKEFAQQVMDRLAQFMGVNSAQLSLNVVPDDVLPGAAGDYTAGKIRVSASQLAAPPQLAKTLAHELGHELLLGGELLSAAAPDHEPLTDLVCVFLGLGILAANATVTESHYSSGLMYGWGYHRIGYLSSRELGYALALYAWFRGDDAQLWHRHLRLDAKVALDQGVKYLEKTGDCWFQINGVPKFAETNIPLLLDGLRHRSASRRLITLWQIQTLSPAAAQVLGSAVQALLTDRDQDVCAAAALSLGWMQFQNTEIIDVLTRHLNDPSPLVRAAAGRAIGQLKIVAPETLLELTGLLKDSEREVVVAATEAFVQLGQAAIPARSRLFNVMLSSIADCQPNLTVLAARAICSCCADPESEIREYFAGMDDDFLPTALAAYDEVRSSDQVGTSAESQSDGEV